MSQLLAAAVVLLVGAVLATLPVKNTWRAGLGIVSQSIATLLTRVAVAPMPGRVPAVS